MPSMVHAPVMNSVSFMLKDKTGEPIVSAFTAVNGRTSPPSPPRSNGINTNGVAAEGNHLRSLSRPNPEQGQESKGPPSGREGWPSTPRASENGHQNGHQNGHHSVSPPLSEQDRSPQSPGKRKRSSSEEDSHAYHSPPEGTSMPTRRRLDSYTTRDDSPPNGAMEHTQQRTLPPIDHDRNWQRRESHDISHPSYSNLHHRDPRDMETSPDGINPHPGSQVINSDGVEITRAGVQVDPKKRKRQFANRTKTGCGTCRRRKKKCDEGKPECINCTRGGFICEGYANKVPWPKNGPTKPHPPLQAKDQFPANSQGQFYHNHGSVREGYPDANPPSSGEGGRARPIVVEDHQQAPRNGWGNGWGEPPRASYPPEHQNHAPAEYSQPPSTAHGRPPSSDPHLQHPNQGPPSQRQHNPRIYHHTPQTMSQVVNSSPVITAEAALHQSQPPQPQPQQPPQQPPHQQPHQQPPPPQAQQQQLPTRHQQHHQQPIHQSPPAPKPPGPPGPPQGQYAPPPPRPQKTEKEKMLQGEAFLPYHPQLTEERDRCKAALFRFNTTSNPKVAITSDERMRHFRAVLAPRWMDQYHGPNPPMGGHLGSHVFVDSPFSCDYGYNISIGEGVTIGMQCKFLDSGRITIGRNTEIGANVTIDTKRVPKDSKSLKGSRGMAVAAEVHIGENVYIGANVTIVAGVKIGTGAIIHPGSVVVRDVPRDVAVQGNPAEVRKVLHWDED